MNRQMTNSYILSVVWDRVLHESGLSPLSKNILHYLETADVNLIHATRDLVTLARTLTDELIEETKLQGVAID